MPYFFLRVSSLWRRLAYVHVTGLWAWECLQVQGILILGPEHRGDGSHFEKGKLAGKTAFEQGTSEVDPGTVIEDNLPSRIKY